MFTSKQNKQHTNASALMSSQSVGKTGSKEAIEMLEVCVWDIC
jgi:hypothetical protein